MKRLHILLTCSSLILIALSINRLTSLTLNYVSSNEFLRWVDFNAMLLIPLAMVIVYYLLKKHTEQAGASLHASWSVWLNLLFVVGIYLFGTSSGDHETTNYLHGRFCDIQEGANKLCSIIAYHDDIFSHFLYYLGLVLLTIALLGFQTLHPRTNKVTNRDLYLIGINALVIALAVFANLAFEPVAIDIGAFAILALLSAGTIILLRREFRRYPVTFYLAIAYGIGIISTVIYKLAT